MAYIGKIPTSVPLTSSDIADGIISSAKIADATIVKDDIANGVLPAPNRNILINGDMSIAQRSTSVSSITGSSYNTLDRFRTNISSAGTWTQSQSTTVPSGQGFSTSLKMDCTTADASLSASDILSIQTRFEGQNLQYLKKGTSSAESLTLSFWVRSNKTGTYICELYDNDNTRHIAKSYTISSADTWEKKTITYAGDTTGALGNDNGDSFRINFHLAAGSNFTSGTLATSWSSYTAANRAVGQVNLADSTSNEWYITGVQLEVGTAASDFEFVPYDVNLQRCQRYFQTYTVMGTMGARNTTDVEGSFEFHTPMRSSPSASQSTAKVFRDMYGGTFTQSSAAISIVDSSDKGLFVGMGNLSSLTQGRIMCATSGTSQFSSEL